MNETHNILSRVFEINDYRINTLPLDLDLQIKNPSTMFNRFFIRPFYNDFDPFFPPRSPSYRLRLSPLDYFDDDYETGRMQAEDKWDPHSTFEQFFKEHEPKTEEEKSFLKKHYSKKEEEKYNPYKVLELNEAASIEEVKDAYRRLALKYHPKNDGSETAAEKFAQVAKAYENILESAKNKQAKKYGFNSFFDEFEKEIDSMFKPKQIKEGNKQEGKMEVEGEKGKENPHEGVLYSESSHYESVNGQQTKYVAEKAYKKDGKLLKVKREEKLKEDGNIEVTETQDNGEEVTKKVYLQEKGKGTKQIEQ